ncbi:MAG: glycosyltransferase [Phycisphaerales bacterium]|nr:glycosyltransferase [Planctomycetota bacterium]
MRILIVSPHFPPWDSVASLRLHAFARAWADAGEDVCVLTTQKRPEHATEPRDCAGIQVHEVDFAIPRSLERFRGSRSGQREAGSPPVQKSGFLNRLRKKTGIFGSIRMPDLTDWWVKPAIARGKNLGSFDVVFASVGPYTSLRVGAALAGGALLVADYRDLWTDNQIFSGLFPFTLYERALENALLAQAGFITTVSEPLAKRLRGRTDAAVRVVPNGYVEADFAGLDPAPFFRDRSVWRIGFTGRIYWPGHDPRPLLRAIAGVPDTKMVVAGPDASLWHQLAAECGAEDRLEHVGNLPRRDALRLQRDCDALAVFEWRDAHEGQMSTKVFEYLRAGPEILVIGGPRDGSVAALVSGVGRGEALGSDKEIIRARICEMSSPGARRTGNARAQVGQYERSAQARALLDELRRLRPHR